MKHLSDEHRKRISETMKGRHLSNEHRKKVSEALKGKHLSDEHKKRLSDAHKGLPNWKKGLTKETDPRIGSSWNKDLTKEIDPRVKAQSEKMKIIMKGCISWNKGRHQSPEARRRSSESHKGQIPWNKGLTKETDPRVLVHAEKMKGKKNNLGHHLSDKTKEKMRQAHLGRSWGRHSDEAKEKIRQASLGHKNTFGRKRTEEEKDNLKKKNVGKHLSDEAKEKLRQKHLGTHHSERSKEKNRQAHLGEKSFLWVDGRTKLYDQYRGDDWASMRRQVLECDEHKCDFSNTGKCKDKLVVHHLAPYHDSHNNGLGNLITLCVHHHNVVERANIIESTEIEKKEKGG